MPIPGSPSTTTNRASSVISLWAASSSPSSRSRPTNVSPASSSPTGVLGGASSEGSWVRMAVSRSRSSRLGSRPSSSRSSRAASARARSASAWRPDRYRARASRACSPSRRGSLGERRPQLADDVAVAAEGEVGVDARLDHGQPLLLQRRRRRDRHAMVDQLDERRPAPQRQRLDEQVARRRRTTRHRARRGPRRPAPRTGRCRSSARTGRAGTRRRRGRAARRRRLRAAAAAGRRSSGACRRPRPGAAPPTPPR